MGSFPTISRQRRWAGWLVVVLGLPALTLVLANTRGTFSFPSQLLLYLLLVVVAATGGLGPAAVAAVGGFFAANWYFTTPRHQLSIADGDHALALVVFLVVGVLVSLLVLQASAHAEEAELVARADELRVSLLRAVSHDLRSPLASIKASVTSLLQQDIKWTEEATLEFLGTIDEEADRLDELVGNLLDMSRLQSGALQVKARPVAYEEIVPAALASLSGPTDTVEIALDETLPRVSADPALLERVVANLTANAIAASGPELPVRVEAGSVADRVDLRIVDRGPGIPPLERDRVFEPFQRMGDTGGGVGLGLAVAKGFVEAMGGELTIEDTPGGGVTMVVGLPEAVET
jgi:two-component system, OmpR family, sensor histidine kinase KdpD